jgi:hypothetical protein
MGQVIPFRQPERNGPPPQTELQRLRGDWNRAHPGATPDESDAAGWAIAKELGL